MFGSILLMIFGWNEIGLFVWMIFGWNRVFWSDSSEIWDGGVRDCFYVLTTQPPELIYPNLDRVGLVRVDKKIFKKMIQLNLTLFDWIGFHLPLNLTQLDLCTPLIFSPVCIQAAQAVMVAFPSAVDRNEWWLVALHGQL